MLCMFLGTPPEKFAWTLTDKKKKFHRFDNLTPLSFIKNHMKLINTSTEYGLISKSFHWLRNIIYFLSKMVVIVLVQCGMTNY